MTSIGQTDLTTGDFWIDEIQGESPITAWDILYMGGEVWPGVWKIEADRSLKLEVVNQSAAAPSKITDPTITDKGYQPATVKAVGQIWDKESWTFIKQLIPNFIPFGNGATRNAYDISHPALYLMGISSVIVTKIRIPPVANQILVVEIDMLEWFPATVVPAGAKALFGNGSPAGDADLANPPGSDVNPIANIG